MTTMPEQPFFVFQLDTYVNLEHILSQLSDCFGLVYLQDKDHPFVGIFPKTFITLQKDFVSLQRTIEFNYITQKEAQFKLSCEFDTISTKHGLEHGFNGGYVAFISYDYAKKQFIKPQHQNHSTQLILAEYDIFIKPVNGRWCLHVAEHLKNHSFILNLLNNLNTPLADNLDTCHFANFFKPRWSKHDYKQAFNVVQNYLYAGDCYQINLTQEFSAKIQSGKILSLIPQLLELSQAPYAGYIAFDDFELLSCSPELFIEFDKNGLLKTRPIKGTLPRGSSTLEDEKLKQQLANSEKDQAENLMIVDLLRNDLSLYAETGSVKVPKLFEIESFAQVHHMVSEIHATLKPQVNPFDVLMSALPGGSITGAPKIRAMEIIDEIEGNNRGAYCGSLGYFNYDGTGRFNILIRSVQRYDDDVSVWAGGGITVASDVDAEYQETLDKVSAILDVLNQYAEKPST